MKNIHIRAELCLSLRHFAKTTSFQLKASIIETKERLHLARYIISTSELSLSCFKRVLTTVRKRTYQPRGRSGKDGGGGTTRTITRSTPAAHNHFNRKGLPYLPLYLSKSTIACCQKLFKTLKTEQKSRQEELTGWKGINTVTKQTPSSHNSLFSFNERCELM